MNVAKAKNFYLEEQKQIALPFIKEGGQMAELGQIRIDEANKVVNLNDELFIEHN